MSATSTPQFVALGGIWIDEIHSGDTEPQNVIGGSVPFASIGARMFAGSLSDVGMFLMVGKDFPQDAMEQLESLMVECEIITLEDKPSARGRIEYSKPSDEGAFSTPGERKPYQRLTAPLNVVPEDLKKTPKLLQSKAFHFFDTPEAVHKQLFALYTLRAQALPATDLDRPFVVWEPHPRSCTPENLRSHQQISMLVDVFSPNHNELAAFFTTTPDQPFSRQTVEDHARAFLKNNVGPGHSGCLVVRAAEHGCMVCQVCSPAVWFLPYYPPGSNQVVDPTGAGNAFLGAFTIGWLETGSYREAAKYGSVAASFVVEQIGPPNMSWKASVGLCNGKSIRKRLGEYETMVVNDVSSRLMTPL
ncbi:hypothetical protein MBLNU230_g8103t1 [Neophaeotheca triangularis]